MGADVRIYPGRGGQSSSRHEILALTDAGIHSRTLQHFCLNMGAYLDRVERALQYL